MSESRNQETGMQGLQPRAAALAIVEAALKSRSGLDEALGRPPFSKLEPRDRGHARALAMATLRHLGEIDHVLAEKLQKAPPETVMGILRIGTAQLFYMEAPDFAAVDTSVELAAAHKATRPFKGLINAVLRGLARAGRPIADPAKLAPDWLLSRWKAAYGTGAALKIAALIGEEPSTDLTFKADADPALAEGLEARPLFSESGPGGSWRTEKGGALTEWPGFDAGAWWVQDAAAAVPARLLALKPGETALDLCAAPGGKTLQLAAAGAEVVAIDRSAQRLQRVDENLARVGLKALTKAADAVSWDDKRTFDAVLLDAPCTATGTFRRHPDVLWAGRPGDIPKLAQAQARLLDSAAARVKPGGRLVYCVCSLEPEEGEGQVDGFLRRHPQFALAPIAPGEGGAPRDSITARGELRLLPFHIEGGADGFYAVRFTRAL
jgi:16S rRNA (cytosine967-C5)-methyltransferase